MMETLRRYIRTEKFWRTLAWMLPRALVKWCFVRVAAHATTGQWGETHPSTITVMEALGRWDEPNVRPAPLEPYHPEYDELLGDDPRDYH